MRYNPATDQACNIDALAAECRAAIQAKPEPARRTTAGDLLAVYTESLRSGHKVCRHFYEFLQLTHAMDVAEAMSNFTERRRLATLLIAGRY